jgi:hypothetical protein
MEDKDLRALYADACAAKGYEPESGQYKLWKEALLWADRRDVKASIERWWQGETQMPMPAQLKPLIEAARKSREARASSKSVLVRWECPCGLTFSGFLEEHDMAGRRCPACDAYMREIQRVRASEAIA